MSQRVNEQIEKANKRVDEGLRRPNGFTLVELLVVVVILGVLAAVVVFAIGGITDRGQLSADKADVTAMEIAEEHAYAASAALSGSPTYVTETQLVTSNMMRSVSTRHDICLRSDAKDYFVDLAGTDCTTVPPDHSGVFSPAP